MSRLVHDSPVSTMRSISTLALLVALPSVAPVVLSQTPLVLEGDAIAGVGNVTSIANLDVDTSGRWWVEVDTDNPDTDVDGAVLRDGVLLYVEGSAAPAPPGTTFDTFDAARSTSAGQILHSALIDGTPGGNVDDDVVYLDDQLVLQGGDPVNAAGVGMGTVHGSISDVQITDNRLMTMRGFFDDPNVSGTTDYYCLLLELDATGGILSETRIAGEGDLLAGQTSVINTIRTGPHASAVNSAGTVIWCADLDTASLPDDAVVYMNATLMAQEGGATGFGGNWGGLVSPEVDLNEAGDWTLKDQLDGGIDIIVKNGQPFRTEGDALAAIAPFTLEYFGNGPADLTESGSVLWFARWSDPDSDLDEGLFLDDTLLIQEGVTQIQGMTVVDVGDQSENYRISPDGSWILFEATVDDGGTDREGAFLMQLSVGTNYCVATPNSTGQPATISGSGTTSVGANDLVLSAGPIAGGQPGIFFYGPGVDLVPFGNGFRCVGGGALQRLSVTTATPGGTLSHGLDNTMPPTAAGQITPGSTWFFQAWYRDPAGAGAFFDLSDGLEVSFLP